VDVSERPDDPSIGPDDTIYRRIPHGAGGNFVVSDDALGRQRPSSGLFVPDEDGVSVYLASILSGHDLGPESLLRDSTNGVAGASVGTVREVELGVARDAWPDDADEPEHKRNAAHCLIVGLNDLGSSARKKRQSKLAKKFDIVLDPPVE
jgi:hypothetical protein